MPRYLIRLDDACPTMKRQHWDRMLCLLDRFDIKPLIGVVPANQDKHLGCDRADPAFWQNMRLREEGGAEICMHGFNHVCTSTDGGIHPVNSKSEFAGISLEQQRIKISESSANFRHNGLSPRVFFAPGHTFDLNTLHALELETSIRIISDTIALKPYKRGSFYFVPQQIGQCRPFPMGVFTFCYHPNTMTDGNFRKLEGFLVRYHSQFVALDDVLQQGEIGGKTSLDKLLTKSYFFYRTIVRYRNKAIVNPAD